MEQPPEDERKEKPEETSAETLQINRLILDRMIA